MAFISQIEPNEVDESIINEHWYLPIQEALNQFKRNNVWDLIPKASIN